jgi:predicted nucleic-acid-binding Zn-ribbon protein
MITIYKVICTHNECAKNGETFYFQNLAEMVKCGNCNYSIEPIKMTENEIKSSFDYELDQLTK